MIFQINIYMLHYNLTQYTKIITSQFNTFKILFFFFLPFYKIKLTFIFLFVYGYLYFYFFIFFFNRQLKIKIKRFIYNIFVVQKLLVENTN